MPRKILVCRTDALGDTLLTLPVCHALKQVYPQASVHMLVSVYTQPIIENQSSVDHVIAYDQHTIHRGCGGLRKLIATLRTQAYDMALAVFPDRNIAWSLWRAKIPVRIGTARRWWSVLFNKKVHHSRAQALRHEAEYNLDLVRRLGVDVRLEPPCLKLTSQTTQWADQFYKTLDSRSGKKWVVIHPGGHGSSSNWKPEQYGQLAEQVIEKYQCNILLTGSKSEQAILRLVERACKPKLFILEQTVTLPELAALIQKATLFIAGNTGPLHMAAALNIPVVTVFPASGVTGPIRWGPLGDKVRILTPMEKEDRLAVASIPVEEVFAAVNDFIS